MDWLISFIFETLLQEIVAVIAGIVFVLVVQNQWIKWRYGGWRVVIIQDGEIKASRAISPAKTRQIQEETSDLAVFIKGVASPYAWIATDIIEYGASLGLLTIDRPRRTYTLDLDKNPQKQTPPSKTESAP